LWTPRHECHALFAGQPPRHLVELADLQQTLVLLGALQASPIEGVQELVPAARTILVQFAPHIIGAAQLVRRIAACDLSGSVQRSDVLVQIPVRYDGEDLAEVAQILGITAEEVVRRHTGSEWSVAFTGFAPGFAYLSGGDRLQCAAPGHATHQGACGRRGAGRQLQRGVSTGQPRRLADHRRDRCRDVGPGA
jgi:allophanate hydrolase subunit 1